jgi:hypothetical protein
VFREMAAREVKSEAVFELVEDLIDHREWVLDQQSKSDDRMNELGLLTEDFGNASSSEERIEITESIQEAIDEIIYDL